MRSPRARSCSPRARCNRRSCCSSPASARPTLLRQFDIRGDRRPARRRRRICRITTRRARSCACASTARSMTTCAIRWRLAAMGAAWLFAQRGPADGRRGPGRRRGVHRGSRRRPPGRAVQCDAAVGGQARHPAAPLCGLHRRRVAMPSAIARQRAHRQRRPGRRPAHRDELPRRRARPARARGRHPPAARDPRAAGVSRSGGSGSAARRERAIRRRPPRFRARAAAARCSIASARAGWAGDDADAVVDPAAAGARRRGFARGRRVGDADASPRPTPTPRR